MASKRKASYQLVPKEMPKKSKRCESAVRLDQPTVANWFVRPVPEILRELWFEIFSWLQSNRIDNLIKKARWKLTTDGQRVPLGSLYYHREKHFNEYETLLALKRTCRAFYELLKQVNGPTASEKNVEESLKLLAQHFDFVSPLVKKALRGGFLYNPLQLLPV